MYLIYCLIPYRSVVDTFCAEGRQPKKGETTGLQEVGMGSRHHMKI